MYALNEFMLSYWAKNTPEREAVYDGRSRMTYSQLEKSARAAAGFLADRGIARNDRILVCLPNCCEMVTLIFAAAAIGAVLVPINAQHKEHELQHVVDMIDPNFAIFSNDEQIAVLERIDPKTECIKVDLNSGEYALSGMVERSAQREAEVLEDDASIIVCTSGSTGLPKGVIMSVKNLIVPSMDIAERYRMKEEDVSYVPVPLCHMFGIMGVLIAVRTGGKIVLSGKFKASEALELLEKERVSVQYCVATMYEREIDHYESLTEKPDLSSLRSGMIAGAPSVRHCIQWFDKTLGCRLLNAYGMTEVSALCIADYDDSEKIRYEQCGRPGRHAQLAILKDDGSFALAGETGEIVCKSPGVMAGYYNMPDKTAECYTPDGWFKTGDIGVFDSDGVFSVTGRKKDIIIRNGYNVIPSEIEALYYSGGDVDEVCVVGCKDEKVGERIVLFCALKAGVRRTEAELREYAKANISKYKVPDKVVFMDKLPKLPNGKLDKKQLKQLCGE